MYTLLDLLAESLTEADAMPGSCTITGINLSDTDTIGVEATWHTGTIRTTLDDGGPGPTEDTEDEHADDTTWDGTTHPATIIRDLLTSIDSDVLLDAEPEVHVTVPAAALRHALAAYIGDDDVLVVGWDMHLTSTRFPLNRPWATWHRHMRDDITHPRNSLRDRITGRAAVYREGLIAGATTLARTLSVAHDLDEQLTARGIAPAFVDLTMPRLIGACDMTADVLTEWLDTRDRAALTANWPTTTDSRAA